MNNSRVAKISRQDMPMVLIRPTRYLGRVGNGVFPSRSIVVLTGPGGTNCRGGSDQSPTRKRILPTNFDTVTATGV